MVMVGLIILMLGQEVELSYREQLKATILLSLAFMLMFLAYTSVEGIVTKFYETSGHEYYGRISLITIYTFFALSTTYSSSIINTLGYKTVFIGGAFCYSVQDSSTLIIYFTNNPYISMFVVLFSAVLCGTAAGNIWVAQNAYIGDISSKEKLGEMFGIFEGVRSISVVIGFLLAAYVFKYYDGFTFFTLLIPLGLTSMVLLYFLPNPPTRKNKARDDPQNVGLKKIQNYFNLLTIKENFQIYSYETLNSFPSALMSNFAFKLVDASITMQLNESEEDYKGRQTYLFGIVLLWYGIGRFIISFLVRYVTQRIDSFDFCYYSSASCIVGIIVGAIGYYFSNFYILCIFSFIFGISYATTRTSCNILVKQIFKNDLDMIGINYFLSSISFIANVAVLMVLTKISLTLCFIMYFVVFVIITNHTRRISDIFKGKMEDQNAVQLIQRKQ